MIHTASNDIYDFLRTNIVPLKSEKGGNMYRVSAYLTDGTYLPCVIFCSASEKFGANGNRVNVYDLARIEQCRYAFPIEIIRQIRGETRMGWTGFVAKMKDAKMFPFGTDYSMLFFNMRTIIYPVT
jgi:hypothetical protein